MAYNRPAFPPVLEPEAPEPPVAEPEPQTKAAPPKPHSKGGLIAAWVMTGLCAGSVVLSLAQGLFQAGMLWAYIIPNAALFWRAYRPPLRWWQGILVWVGGVVAGASFSVFMGPASFQEQVLTSQGRSGEVFLAKLGAFVPFIAVGIILMWLGSWRRLGRDRKNANG